MADDPTVGRRFPGGSRTIAHWENFLLTEATGSDPLADGLAHPIHLFHVPIEGAGTSIAELFALAGAEADDRVGLEAYDWEWFEPLREDVAYDCEGSVVAFEAVEGAPHDRFVFEIELRAEGRLVARVVNTWQIWRSA